MADSNRPGGLGDFLRQLNEVAKELGEAMNQTGPVKRNPAPAAGTVRQPRPKPEAQATGLGQASAAQKPAEVRRSLGQTPEEREEQLRQHRENFLREEKQKQQRKQAHEKLQAQHRQEQQKLEAARLKKKGCGAVASCAAAKRYAKFLKGGTKNIRDAVILAEIIGPCRAVKGWQDF